MKLGRESEKKTGDLAFWYCRFAAEDDDWLVGSTWMREMIKVMTMIVKG